ncbi:MAG: translocation/assembly module TamB domain-containing protein, partial [Bryobacteraceae bacterium]
DIGIKSDVQLRLHDVALRGTQVTALGGKFQGQAELKDFRHYSAKGNVTGMSVQELSRTAGVKGVAWNGLASGPVEVTGSFVQGARDFKGSGQFDIVPAAGGIPISGRVDASYDQRAQRLALGQSSVRTEATSLDFNGTLGEHLAVKLESRDLNDLLPAFALTSSQAPQTLPLKLNAGGRAVFEGTVDGKWDTADLSGNAVIDRFNSQGQNFDKLTASLGANPAGLRIPAFTLIKEGTSLDGSLNLGLQNWKLTDASAIAGTMRLRGAQIEKLLADAGQKPPVKITGALSGSIVIKGTYGSPTAVMDALVDKPAFDTETFDRLRAEISYKNDSLEVRNGTLEQGPAVLSLSGSYKHAPNDFQNGSVLFDIGTRGFTLEQVRKVQEYRPGMKGRFILRLAGGATVQQSKPELNALNGQFAVQNLVVDNTALGNFVVDATTTAGKLTLGTSGELRGSVLKGNGVFELTGDYPGTGQMEFSRMTVATIQELFRPKGKDPFPVDGFVEGKLTFSGPAKKPELMTARMEIPHVEIFSTQRATLGSKQAQDLTLRNAGPIVITADGKGIHLLSGHLVGRDSNIEATGTLNWRDEKNPYDFRVNGELNLAILQDYQPGLVATGHSAVNATIRGTFDQPAVNGRMELKNATFYLEDFPNGIDQANGTVIFDRNRATISDKLTALTGGGTIALTGFVGFGKGEIVYRLAARADNVRYRGDGVSTTGNANVSLTGTSTHALLAGTVTIVKAGFNPKADLGSLLLASSVPISTPTTPNQFLRGLQLDIHVETIPNLQFMTSVTSDLQAEADLRIRGIAVRPVLSGQINVNQGDVQFFGNKYTINRGNIAFYNTTKIEPVLDMDLETQVRGVTVNINFSGPINKLNLSYRSDPPLQSNEIVALLAVGRAPGTNSSLASSQTVSQQSSLSSSTNSLLGQAIAAPISGRLQRFFGVSRLKIDPLLTGVNAVPQARLTLEQQISKDITLTYVTNLAQANQQLVKIEWDINRTWSAVAIREENGVFGIDFLYKKRFK